MLGRILDVLERDGETLPALRHLSYGGGRMPTPVVERALALLPHVGFVNAYGLTETSSTISVLGPDDHRAAIASDDPAVRAPPRLGGPAAAGARGHRPRTPTAKCCRPGSEGEVWVRGEQVAGEYLGTGGGPEAGWFADRDGGWFDDDGFLYLAGRLDDVIVRGAENISPGEIEDVLVEHPAVARGRRRRHPRHGVGRGRSRPRSCSTTAPSASEAELPGLGARPAALVAHARARGVPRQPALQRDRQAPAPRAQGRAHVPRRAGVSADAAVAAGPVGLAQLALQHLARGVAGELGDEVDRGRALVAGEVGAGVGDEVLGGDGSAAGDADDDGLDRLAPPLVGHADDGDVGDRRVVASARSRPRPGTRSRPPDTIMSLMRSCR